VQVKEEQEQVWGKSLEALGGQFADHPDLIKAQADYILEQFKAQGDLISSLSTAQTEYLARLSTASAVLNRAVLISVLVIGGAGLVLDAPVGPTIGLTLIGIAIAFAWAKRGYRLNGKQSKGPTASTD
jgi:hypothetical protein